MATKDHKTDEFADAGEERVAALLNSLKRVDPPGDFDIRVRARIAQGRPLTSGPSWFPATVRVAVPAAVLFAVGGYFGYSALYREGNMKVPVVAESRPPFVTPATQPTVEAVASHGSTPTTEVAAAKPPGNAADTTGTPKKSPAANKPAQRTGGSVDMAVREANSVTPRDENLVPSGGNSGGVKTSSLSVREVFAAMGVRATHSGTGWRVSAAAGAAAAAGLKAGDIIEAVNGAPVGVNSTFDAGFTGRSLRIRRDGVVLQLAL